MHRGKLGAELQKLRAQIIDVEEGEGTAPTKIHIWGVYAGGNTLRFRCPYCGTIETHGADESGKCVHSGTPYFHCRTNGPHPKNGNCVWVMHEVLEGMDLRLAGDLGKEMKRVCPRRLGEPGYDQLGHGRIDYSKKTSMLIKEYKKGAKNG